MLRKDQKEQLPVGKQRILWGPIRLFPLEQVNSTSVLSLVLLLDISKYLY
jgi:hypothetical protein